MNVHKGSYNLSRNYVVMLSCCLLLPTFSRMLCTTLKRMCLDVLPSLSCGICVAVERLKVSKRFSSLEKVSSAPYSNCTTGGYSLYLPLLRGTSPFKRIYYLLIVMGTEARCLLLIFLCQSSQDPITAPLELLCCYF